MRPIHKAGYGPHSELELQRTRAAIAPASSLELSCSPPWLLRTGPNLALLMSTKPKTAMSLAVNVHPRARSSSFSLSCSLESTLGIGTLASADWRICPTSFEPRQRASDARLGPALL